MNKMLLTSLFSREKRCFETEMYANSQYISIEWNLQTMTILKLTPLFENAVRMERFWLKLLKLPI